MNLIHDAWIPIQRNSGKKSLIAPWQLTESEDPVIALNSSRSDFDGALMQFLIGLLQTAAAPKNEEKWVDWLEDPPAPETIKEKLSSVEQAFELNGDGACFMQDFDQLNLKIPNPVSELLMDAPGGNTLKENKDHFVKRNQVKAICSSCTATALFTLQTNAPAGGQGHRTSLRGGGPLTTLVRLDPQDSGLPDTLWVNIWLNIQDKQQAMQLTGNWGKSKSSDIFPWLAATRTSKKNTGQGTFPQDVHPYQMYWGMPRRIRVLWDDNHSGYCDLCGLESDHLVTHYETQNYGVNYEGAWQHPLSPHYINKDDEILPQHTPRWGLAYRHWLDLTETHDSSISAHVVDRYRKLIAKFSQDDSEQFRLTAFGYDMDNMKARCWYDSTFPLYVFDDVFRVIFSERIQLLTTTATDVSKSVQSCIKEAWFRRPGDTKGDMSFLSQAFFQRTQSAFYQTVESLLSRLREDSSDKEVLNSWYKLLVSSAHEVFDYWANSGDFALADPKRISIAKSKLIKLLNGRKLRGQLQVDKKVNINKEAIE
jgi:CRISPR system Cascade subunit CasA